MTGRVINTEVRFGITYIWTGDEFSQRNEKNKMERNCILGFVLYTNLANYELR